MSKASVDFLKVKEDLMKDKIVEKYGGYVNRQNEEGVFATEIMLPL